MISDSVGMLGHKNLEVGDSENRDLHIKQINQEVVRSNITLSYNKDGIPGNQVRKANGSGHDCATGCQFVYTCMTYVSF